MRLIYLSLFALTLFLSACNQAAVKPKKVVKKQEIVEKKVAVSKVPAWVINPDNGGYTGAIGIVKLISNKKKQNYIARKLATAELQERKRVLFESKITGSQNVDSSGSKTELVQEISQTSSHYNSYDIIQKDEYSDDENYYVWMVIKQ